MRLNKRIAIGVLAAVMALSMLTACSDSGGGSTTAPGGGSGTSVGGNTNTEPDNKKDDTTQPPKEDNKKDDTKNDTMPLQTRAEKFFSGRYTINGAKWTYTVQRTQTSLDDGRQSTGIHIIASDGKRTVDRMLDGNGDITMLNDWKQKKKYFFDSKDQDGSVSIQEWDEDYGDTHYGYLCYDVWHESTYKEPTLREFADEYIAGTYQVDGVNYYAESYIHNYDTGTQEARIYCFDQGDTEGLNLRYYINIEKYAGTSQQTNKYKVMNISNTFDASLLQVPEGRDVYLRVGNDYVLQEEKTQKDNYPN